MCFVCIIIFGFVGTDTEWKTNYTIWQIYHPNFKARLDHLFKLMLGHHSSTDAVEAVHFQLRPRVPPCFLVRITWAKKPVEENDDRHSSFFLMTGQNSVGSSEDRPFELSVSAELYIHHGPAGSSLRKVRL